MKPRHNTTFITRYDKLYTTQHDTIWHNMTQLNMTKHNTAKQEDQMKKQCCSRCNLAWTGGQKVMEVTHQTAGPTHPGTGEKVLAASRAANQSPKQQPIRAAAFSYLANLCKVEMTQLRRHKETHTLGHTRWQLTGVQSMRWLIVMNGLASQPLPAATLSPAAIRCLVH